MRVWKAEGDFQGIAFMITELRTIYHHTTVQVSSFNLKSHIFIVYLAIMELREAIAMCYILSGILLPLLWAFLHAPHYKAHSNALL